MSNIYTTVEILENTTEVSLVEKDAIEIDISEDITTVEINNLAVPTQASAEVNDLTAAVTWANVPDAYITRSSVVQHQAALSISESQISDLQKFVQENAPSGAGVREGALWYQTSTDNLYVYREVSPNVLNWVPVIIGSEENSDTLDGGLY